MRKFDLRIWFDTNAPNHCMNYMLQKLQSTLIEQLSDSFVDKVFWDITELDDKGNPVGEPRKNLFDV